MNKLDNGESMKTLILQYSWLLKYFVDWKAELVQDKRENSCNSEQTLIA